MRYSTTLPVTVASPEVDAVPSPAVDGLSCPEDNLIIWSSQAIRKLRRSPRVRAGARDGGGATTRAIAAVPRSSTRRCAPSSPRAMRGRRRAPSPPPGGSARRSIFYHFGSVDALLLAVMDQVSGERLSRYRSRLHDISSLSALTAAMAELYAEDLRLGHLSAVQEIVAGLRLRPRARRRDPGADAAVVRLRHRARHPDPGRLAARWRRRPRGDRLVR